MMKIHATPFLKWAGGKRQLIPQLEQLYPGALKRNDIQTYVEPFLGGGAMFFHLQSLFNFDDVVLNDSNPDLILTYKVVRDAVNPLILSLFNLEVDYLRIPEHERTTMYYSIRDDYNAARLSLDYETFSPQWISQAARLIFLNKTCFNGLFRVNRAGDYNVSFGKHKNPTICDAPNLEAVHCALQGVTLMHGDFEQVTDAIVGQAFVFLDPPYRPLTATSSFNSYAKTAFNDESQKRLANWFQQLHTEKAAALMLCNSDPTDRFFDSLYSNFRIRRVLATRSISADGTRRRPVREIVVTNSI